MNRLRAVLAAACVLAPVWAWSPTIIGDARLDGALLSLLVFLLALASLRSRPVWLPGTGFLLAALLVGVLPLWLRSGPPPWGGLADRAPLLAGWMLACLAAGPAALAARAAPAVFFGVAAAAAYGLLQVAGWDPLGFRPEPHSPPTAPFENSNAAAEVLAPVLCAATAWWAARGPAGRRALPLGAALCGAAFHLGFLGVTAAWISVPAGLLLAALRNRRALPAALLILAALGAGEAGRRVIPQPVDPRAGEAPPAPDLGPAPTFQVRLAMDLAGIERAAVTPFGIGLGRFETDYPFWRPAEELRLSSRGFTDPAVPRPATPHNEALLALLELGWGGAVLALVAVLRALRRPGRAAWAAPGLLAVGLHALVRSPFSDNPAALAVAALLLAASSSRTASAGGRRGGLLLSLCLVPLLAVPSQFCGEFALARRFRAPAGAARIDALREAVAWRPWDATAWSLLAAELGAAGAPPAQLRRALLAALEHDPGNLHALTALVKHEILQGDELAGLKWMLLAERVAPRHPAVVDARNRWLGAHAARMRRAGIALLRQQDAAYHAWLAGANLLDALIAARTGDWEEARRELRQAASGAPASAPLLERLADRPELDVATVRAAAGRVLPELLLPGETDAGWDALLGPPD